MEARIKISMNEIQKQYEAVETLGKGNYGSVFAYRKKDTQQQYALKIIKSNNSYKRNDALNEIQIMKILDHPRIVRIFKYYDETFSCYDKSERYETGLLLQRGIGSLQHCFKDKKYEYDFEDIMKFIVKFIDLGAYLQSKLIVHRDIKPGNIIIFDQRLQFKLCDFGLSCIASQRPRGFAGTPAYCSPGLKKYLQHGDHKKIPPTNPYKDDVYSFAITSQQVIKRRYSLEACPKDITVLLDQMLKHDERQRPTFSHLLHHNIVQKYLENQRENLQHQRQFKNIQIIQKIIPVQAFTKKKIAQKDFPKLNNTQKSKKIKDQITYNKVCFGIRTICSLDNQFILCGTDRGQVYALNRQKGQSIKLSLTYKDYVAKITIDKMDNIWIAGGDGKVQIIQKDALIKYLKDNKQAEENNKNIFSLEKPTSIIKVNIPKVQIKQIIDQSYQKCISEMYCEDQDHFAVGYCSGIIAIKWGEYQPLKKYSIHTQPITSFVVKDNQLYSGDFQGNVKKYSLSKKIVQRVVYNLNQELIGFTVSKHENGQNIQGITCKGQIKTINFLKSSETTFHAEILAKNIIGACFGERHYYLLTVDGQIYFRNSFLAKLEFQGNIVQNWICILQNSQHELIVATRQGQISVVFLEN